MLPNLLLDVVLTIGAAAFVLLVMDVIWNIAYKRAMKKHGNPRETSE